MGRMLCEWFSQASVRELSREEYRVLARRWAAELRDSAGFSAEETRLLVESFHRAVERLPTEGDLIEVLSVWDAARAQAAKQVVREGERYLSAGKLDALRALLARQVSR